MPPAPAVSPALGIVIVLMFLGLLSAIVAAWAWVIIRVAIGAPVLPRAPRRVVPWGLRSVSAVAMLFFAMQVVAALGYFGARWIAGARGGHLSQVEALTIAAVSGLAMVQLTPPLLRLTCGARLADLGLAGRDVLPNVLRGIWACFLLLPAVYGVSFLTMLVSKRTAHPVEDLIFQGGGETMALAAFMAVVVAPVSEEMLFRGVLLGWFWKLGAHRPKPAVATFGPEPGPDDPFAPLVPAEPTADILFLEVEPPDPFAGRWRQDLAANLLASLIFAALHYKQWPAPVPLFLLALGLGEVYRRTGSLIAPIAMHATFNGLSTGVMLLMAAGGIRPK